MSGIVQLQDRIEVETPIGRGFAIMYESNTDEHYWTIILKNGAFVTYKQKFIRAVNNYTEGVGNITHDKMKEIIERI